MKIHHIGYAVKNIEKSRDAFLQLGYRNEGDIVVDDARNVKILFMVCGGGQKLELIEAYNTEKPSPVDNYLRKQKDMAVPYHLCYEASDIEGKIQELQKMHPKNDYSFNLGKMQKQHFSFLFAPQKARHGGLV